MILIHELISRRRNINFILAISVVDKLTFLLTGLYKLLFHRWTSIFKMLIYFSKLRF